MTSRRRALMIASLGSYFYDINIIDSLLLGESTSPDTYLLWYSCKEFETDTETGMFTMTNPALRRVSYNSPSSFTTSMRNSYCMKEVSTGNIMYYFTSGCTYSLAYDAATGLYSVTAHGNIKVLTPKAAS